MKKSIFILLISLIGLSGFSQSTHPQIDNGYSQYLVSHPLDVAQRYNVRVGQTFIFAQADLDTIFHYRANWGQPSIKDSGLSAGAIPYITSASVPTLANSVLSQSGGNVSNSGAFLLTGSASYVAYPHIATSPAKSTTLKVFSDSNYAFSIRDTSGGGLKFSTVQGSSYATIMYASALASAIFDTIPNTSGKFIFLGTNAAGDLSGTFRSPTVAKINGNTIPSNSVGRLTMTSNSGTLAFTPIGVTTYYSPVPFDSTGTISAANMARGYITSTSGAATTITTPTATQLATALGSVGQGTRFDFIVDNSAGSNTITITLGSGFGASSVITGGTTLTVANGVVGTFEVIFTSTSAAKVGRIQ